MEELLTIKQTAAGLNLAPATVRTWIKSSKLQGLRLGRRTLRVTRAELQRLIDEATTGVNDK